MVAARSYQLNIGCLWAVPTTHLATLVLINRYILLFKFAYKALADIPTFSNKACVR